MVVIFIFVLLLKKLKMDLDTVCSVLKMEGNWLNLDF